MTLPYRHFTKISKQLTSSVQKSCWISQTLLHLDSYNKSWSNYTCLPRHQQWLTHNSRCFEANNDSEMYFTLQSSRRLL